MGICSNCNNNQIIKTQMNDVIPPLSVSYVKQNDSAVYFRGVSISRKSTANTKSVSSSHQVFQNQLSLSLLKEINLIRTSPQYYSDKLEQCLEFIKMNTLNSKYYFYYDKESNKKVKLKVTKNDFKECITFLKNFDNDLLQPLEYSSELTIPFPNEDPSLANDRNYLHEQIERLKKRIKNKFVFLDFQYDISPNPVVSAIVQAVDSQKVNYQRRNNFLNEYAKYVGVSVGKVNDELFCFYLVFAKLK